MNFRLALRALPLLIAPLAACGGDDGPTTKTLADVPAATRQAAVTTYAQNVAASYDSTLEKAKALQTAVKAFVAAPSKANLDAAKAAWVTARVAYGPTEAFRFYGGPIDDSRELEGRINSWPIDENFIDSVKDNRDSGLINDLSFTISKEAIAAKNAEGGEANISCGWHAAEFLLWGQDFSATGPGDRPYTDFLTTADATLPNGARRGQYLAAVVDLLVDDLTAVGADWKGTGGAYRAAFVAEPAETSLAKMLKGIGALAAVELPNERMNNAYARREQEEEQSCFSDTTASDLLGNAEGVQNVWLGRGPAASGTGLDAVLRPLDSALADKTTADVAALVAAVKAIPAPFDQAILDDAAGRPKIKAAIDAAAVVKGDLEGTAEKLGLKINFNDN